MKPAFIVIAFFALFFDSAVVLAQDTSSVTEPCASIMCQVMGQFPQVNAWILVLFTFLGGMLRLVSELVAFVAMQLDKSDKGWAAKLAEWSMGCASVVGWFGGGKSKKITEWYAADPMPKVEPAPVEKSVAVK